MVDTYAQRRELMVERINAIEGLNLIRPEATFYAFVNVKDWGLNSWDLATQLLEKHNLATIPGSAFGPAGEGYLRLTFAVSPETINEACDRLEAVAAGRCGSEPTPGAAAAHSVVGVADFDASVLRPTLRIVLAALRSVLRDRVGFTIALDAQLQIRS